MKGGKVGSLRLGWLDMQEKGPLGNGVGPETKKEKHSDRPSREPRQNGRVNLPKQDSEDEKKGIKEQTVTKEGVQDKSSTATLGGTTKAGCKSRMPNKGRL